MAVDLKGMKTSTESPGSTFSGYPVLAAILVLLILMGWNIAASLVGDETLTLMGR